MNQWRPSQLTRSSRRRSLVKWAKRLGVALLGVILVGVIVFIALPYLLPSFGGRIAGERRARIEKSPQFRDGAFRNAVPTRMMIPGGAWTTLRRQLGGDEVRVPPAPPPIEPRTPADYATAPRSGLRATWIGHASTLVEIDGQRVLTDPIFSERCSPVSFAGPQRFHPPPIALADLPPIAAVVISHDHFDHLDRDTVSTLAARGTKIIVPLGIGAHLEAWDLRPDTFAELDWWQEHRIGGLTITSTPSRHYSGRYPGRGDETLWSSWVIAGPRHRVFFSGDTGYAPSFAEVGRRLGPFDLAIVKIGAYGETWPDIHVTPEEAVQIHRDVGGKVLLPVHWGTFNLGFHSWNEPADRVVAAAAAARITLVVPKPGQWFEPADVPAGGLVATWWR